MGGLAWRVSGRRHIPMPFGVSDEFRSRRRQQRCYSCHGRRCSGDGLRACLVLVAVLGLVPPAKGSSRWSPAGQHESDVWHDNEEVLR
jgi:hypothetical protein